MIAKFAVSSTVSELICNAPPPLFLTRSVELSSAPAVVVSVTGTELTLITSITPYAGGVPVPFKETLKSGVCPSALSLKLKTAVAEPTASGLKRTVALQSAPEASEPQLLAGIVKLPSLTVK